MGCLHRSPRYSAVCVSCLQYCCFSSFFLLLLHYTRRKHPPSALCMPKHQRPQGCAPLLPSEFSPLPPRSTVWEMARRWLTWSKSTHDPSTHIRQHTCWHFLNVSNTWRPKTESFRCRCGWDISWLMKWKDLVHRPVRRAAKRCTTGWSRRLDWNDICGSEPPIYKWGQDRFGLGVEVWWVNSEMVFYVCPEIGISVCAPPVKGVSSCLDLMGFSFD